MTSPKTTQMGHGAVGLPRERIGGVRTFVFILAAWTAGSLPLGVLVGRSLAGRTVPATR